MISPPFTIHIGISGIIFGMAFFLVASGLFRREPTSLSVAIFVVLMYGGMIEGFAPQPGISWQSHISGAMVGVILAYVLRNYGRELPSTITTVAPERHFFEEYGH